MESVQGLKTLRPLSSIQRLDRIRYTISPWLPILTGTRLDHINLLGGLRSKMLTVGSQWGEAPKTYTARSD